MKVRNFLTGNYIPDTRARKLEDGYWVDFDTYNRISHELRQGRLWRNDIEYQVGINEALTENIRRLYTLIKKYKMHNKTTFHKVVEKVINLEHSRAVSWYKKYRVALKKEEHIEIIKSLIDDSFLTEFKEDKMELVDGRSIYETSPEYFDDVEHFKTGC